MSRVTMAPPSSVGEAVAERGMFTIDHPQYKVLADAVASKLAEVTTERAAARASAKSLPVSVAMSAAGYAELAELYPEFRMVQYGMSRPGHADWVQSRRLANEWLMLQAERYGNTALHLGGSVSAYLTSDQLDGTILVDQTNPVSVHESHAQTVDAYKFFSSYGLVSEDLARPLPRSKYLDYLKGESTPVMSAAGQLPRAEVCLVDLTMKMMPPVQVASMMMESGAEVAFGFFMYTPAMVTDESGLMPGSSIRFVRKPREFIMQYPEGSCAVNRLDYREWEPWLVNHTFSVGLIVRKWFQLELLKNRGSFMFFRLVRLDSAPDNVDITHALDLGATEPSYVVRVPEPVGLDLDLKKPSSWKVVPTVISKRVIDRAYNDAMTLPRQQFTTHAVRKKIIAANDRFVVSGTSVKVNSPLGMDVVLRATLAVTTRAFVDRYEAGRLTKEVLDVAKRYMSRQAPGGPGFILVFLRGLATLVAKAGSGALGRIDNTAASMAEWINSTFRTEFKFLPGQFTEPIGYIRLGEQCASLTSVLKKVGAGALVASSLPAAGMPGRLMAQVFVSKAAETAGRGLEAGWAMVRPVSVPESHAVESEHVDVGYRDYSVEEKSLFEDEVDVEAAEDLISAARLYNVVGIASEGVKDTSATVVVGDRAPAPVGLPDVSEDPVGDLNRFYSCVNPGVAPQDLEQDTASIALDPQDRYVTAVRMVVPTDMSSVPKPKEVFLSRVEALNVSKRQNTPQELISATAARNLSAPQVSLPQDEDAAIADIWKVFLDTACVPDAREKIAGYKADPVALTEFGLADWNRQADPVKRERVIKALTTCMMALEEMDVAEYMLMLKADVKPDLTTKPIFNRIEPQVIAYHRTELNALFSAIFRVIMRRFLSLLKPNFKLILLKDLKEVERTIQNVHPFGGVLKYLENDFNKFDKSQGRFVYLLEAFVFTELGMNEKLLSHWLSGHKFAKLRSVSLLMSLHVDYQRKSGDATTAGGNGILNMLSVVYAYQGTIVIWAIFMGDDSLVCTRSIGGAKYAVQVLAEVFNLGAKTIITEQPYFASNFLLVDDVNAVVRFIPDPVKRAARWSMSVSAKDPQWHERWVSARDACSAYLDEACLTALPALVAGRYDVSVNVVGPAVRAVAAAIVDEKAFRSLWDEKSTMVTYG